MTMRVHKFFIGPADTDLQPRDTWYEIPRWSVCSDERPSWVWPPSNSALPDCTWRRSDLTASPRQWTHRAEASSNDARLLQTPSSMGLRRSTPGAWRHVPWRHRVKHSEKLADDAIFLTLSSTTDHQQQADCSWSLVFCTCWLPDDHKFTGELEILLWWWWRWLFATPPPFTQPSSVRNYAKWPNCSTHSICINIDNDYYKRAYISSKFFQFFKL